MDSPCQQPSLIVERLGVQPGETELLIDDLSPLVGFQFAEDNSITVTILAVLAVKEFILACAFTPHALNAIPLGEFPEHFARWFVNVLLGPLMKRCEAH
jgi:hypothetical protein